MCIANTHATRKRLGPHPELRFARTVLMRANAIAGRDTVLAGVSASCESVLSIESSAMGIGGL
ncbi:hypothetical protein N9018_00485 [Rhodopirellula sp.]|nr:hypothetical protein [Rhodopirellula sp.]